MCETLHSNMFLLILPCTCDCFSESIIFTFQYVSINMHGGMRTQKAKNTLHSNMFLLILSAERLSHGTENLYIPICFY